METFIFLKEKFTVALSGNSFCWKIALHGFWWISFLNQQASLTDAMLTSSYGTVKYLQWYGGKQWISQWSEAFFWISENPGPLVLKVHNVIVLETGTNHPTFVINGWWTSKAISASVVLVPADMFFVYFFSKGLSSLCCFKTCEQHQKNQVIDFKGRVMSWFTYPSIKRVTPFWRKKSQPTQIFSGKIRYLHDQTVWRLRWFKGRILIALPFCKRTRISEKKSLQQGVNGWMSARWTRISPI